MSNIFLAPRSNETSHDNFKSTILDGRPYEFLESYLDAKEKKVLSKYSVVSIWGNKESLRSRWEKMQPGDYVLFYAKGKFYYSARVLMKKFSTELGAKLWPADEDGKPWSCLFFVDNLRKMELPIGIVQELAEYEPTWDRVQGFMRLRDSAIEAIKEKFGSVEEFINQDPKILEVIERVLDRTNEEVIEGEKEEETNKSDILKQARSYQITNEGYRFNDAPRKVRVENRQQKLRVAKIEDYTCQICGWSLEWVNSSGRRSFRIDVDHIIDKAKGGTEEVTNLWALCPNCHVKKTLGVIIIDPVQKSIAENGKPLNFHHDNHLGWKAR